jgi:hypothetical protein
VQLADAFATLSASRSASRSVSVSVAASVAVAGRVSAVGWELSLLLMLLVGDRSGDAKGFVSVENGNLNGLDLS